MKNVRIKTYKDIKIVTWDVGKFKRFMPLVSGPVATFHQLYQAKRVIDKATR
jgi:hypothetical protein